MHRCTIFGRQQKATLDNSAALLISSREVMGNYLKYID